MAYDEKFAERIRRALGSRPGLTEKKMFGGVAFLLNGKMFCGIANENLMVRVGPDHHAELLAEPHVLPMDFTGRPMKGYVYVEAAGTRTAAGLAKWIERGATFVATLETEVKPKRRKVPARSSRARR